MSDLAAETWEQLYQEGQDRWDLGCISDVGMGSKYDLERITSYHSIN